MHSDSGGYLYMHAVQGEQDARIIKYSNSALVFSVADKECAL